MCGNHGIKCISNLPMVSHLVLSVGRNDPGVEFLEKGTPKHCYRAVSADAGRHLSPND